LIPSSAPPIDSRTVESLLNQFLERRSGYLPTWNPEPKTAGAAVGPIFARLLSAILERLNQVPAKDKLALLDYLGLRLIPAQPSRAPIVFQLSKGASDSAAPVGTRVAAPPPPGSSQQIVFETEQDSGIAAAKLAQVISLWPGRDQYVDHSAALVAGTPFTLYDSLKLTQTDHILYLGHQTLLAFAGSVHLLVTFDLLQGSSSPLDLTWEYWDGTVWRGFIENPSSCLDSVGTGVGLDGTNGLTTDGAVHLDVDGAQTASTTVNGLASYWIRARLSQPLTPDPAAALPIVNAINLRTKIDRRMEANVSVSFDSLATGDTSNVTVQDECGQALSVAANIVIADSDDSTVMPATVAINSGSGGTSNDGSGSTSDISFSPGHTYQFTISFLGLSGTEFVPFHLESAAAGSSANITITVKVEGLLPDKALCDGKTLDLTKAFNPLGANPRLGSAFFFKQNEVFGKPGAQVQIYLDPAQLPDLSVAAAPGPADLPHTVNWEYWNGWEWTLLVQSTANLVNPNDFTKNEIVKFTVPQDFRQTTVNNEPGLWMRARLVSGGYGLEQTTTVTNTDPQLTINYVQPRPPSVAVFRIGYSWVQGPKPFDYVFTYNDFQYVDRSDAARLPGNSFSPFMPISETDPAVYLGFDGKLPVNNFGIYADIVEQPGASEGPALVWEYFNGAGWQSAPVEDGTQSLQLPGILNFIPAADNTALARFGDALYWFRGRLKEDGQPAQSVINNLFTNAVWASQRETFNNAALGASNGAPSQMFQFSQVPILPGQVIEVQELSGARANTEWRLVVLDVTLGDADAVSVFESMLSAEGSQTDFVLDSIRLTRDKTKKVIAVWVQWNEQQNFFASAADSRDYVLDHASGRLFFGDGDSGKIPPAGAAIRASVFRSGGGLAGNVQANTITQLLGSVSGIQSVSNPRSAEGGADGETLQGFSIRGPMTIRNRGRALTLSDYETMAREASAGVGFARAIPTCDPSGRTVPGWVTLIIIPQSQDARPVPSFGLREDVRLYLEQHATANLATAHSIEVIGPDYLPVDVTATLAPIDPATAGEVEQAALDALSAFLHPLYGGPGGLGWDLGRGVFLSDVAAVLGAATGVDYVEDLKLYVNGVLQGDMVNVPAGKNVVAGQFQISLVLPVGG
jgi:Baseplate J-like protein